MSQAWARKRQQLTPCILSLTFAKLLVTSPWPFKGVPSTRTHSFPLCLFLVQLLLVTGDRDCYVKSVPEHKSSSVIAQLLCSLTASCSPSSSPPTSPPSISISLPALLILPHVPVKTDYCNLLRKHDILSVIFKQTQRKQEVFTI